MGHLRSDMFASTGGDGVHFSILSADSPVDERPVVMTVPMMGDEGNVVVGANLKEFLDLGCTFGYFALEQLVYHRDQTIRHIQSGRHAFAEYESGTLLPLLRTRLLLKPWPNVETHLAGLQSRYQHLIATDPI